MAKNLKNTFKEAIVAILSPKLPLTVLIFTDYGETTVWSEIVGIYSNPTENNLIAYAKSYCYTGLRRRLPLTKFKLVAHENGNNEKTIYIDDEYSGEGWGQQFSIVVCQTKQELIEIIFK